MECEETLHPYSHMFLCQKLIEEVPDAAAVIMAQLYLKEGMKHWKGKGQAEAKYEMKQLHFRDTFKTNHYIYLNEYQKKSILESHTIIKEKRDGTIKGITVAGVNKQMYFISKEDSSSPKVETEAVILPCIIDAEEKREVNIIDITNEFIQTRVKN